MSLSFLTHVANPPTTPNHAPTMRDLLQHTKDLTLLPQPCSIRELDRRTNQLSKTIASLNLSLIELYYYIKRHNIDLEPEEQEDVIPEPSELIAALSTMKIDDKYDEEDTPRHVAIAYARKKQQDLLRRLPLVEGRMMELWKDVEFLCLQLFVGGSSESDPRLDHEEDGRKRRGVRLLYSSMEEFKWRIEDIWEGVKELPPLLVPVVGRRIEFV